MVLLREFGLSIESIDKSFDDNLYRKVRALRKECASELSSTFEADDGEVIDGMLLSVLERAPFENTLSVLQFNIQLTERVCSKILSDDIGLIEKVGMYAATVELGAKEFINPVNTNQVQTHLGAAKNNGFFFTPPSVALRMVIAALKYNEQATSVFDPACGAGVFLAYQLLLNPNVQTMVGVEIDHSTAEYARRLLRYLYNKTGKQVTFDIECADFFDYFNNHKSDLYDLIVMNPPYGSLKFLASDLTDSSTKAELSEDKQQDLCTRLRNDMMDYSARLRTQFRAYGIGKGTLEYSKLFLAATHEMLATGGYIVAITPSSWLGDETSTAFRNSIISGGYVYELWFFPEVAKIFQGVNQPTVVSIIGKQSSPVIVVSNPVFSVADISRNQSNLDLQSVLAVSGAKCKLPKCDETSLRLLVKLQRFGQLKDIENVTNSRGELDLTAYKNYISAEPTGYRLIRGDHIQGFNLKEPSFSDKAGYVDYEGFCKCIESSAKRRFIDKERIAIPQCSYLQKKKRIEAAIIPVSCVIGNSCNYLAINDESDDPLRLHYYWAWINSFAVEWIFRIFSYNNHVANREINVIPCVPFEKLDKDILANLELALKYDGVLRQYKLNAVISRIFSLNVDEYEFILSSLAVENTHEYITEYNNFIGD